jgi:uncharacterized protein YlzI (FlbEa/FlbD family)
MASALGSKATDAQPTLRRGTGGDDPDSRARRTDPGATLLPPMTSTTEITLVNGGHYLVQGEVKDVEQNILDAARGSIMQLSWFTDAESGEQIGINPESVVTLRALGS